MESVFSLSHYCIVYLKHFHVFLFTIEMDKMHHFILIFFDIPAYYENIELQKPIF